MEVAEISRRLSERAEAVANMLLPGGRTKGREFEAGSVDGQEGKSLKVCIAGSKQGVWSDFASGEGGDLLDLWRLAKGISLSDAIKEAKDYLGISDPTFTTPKKKSYRRPQAPPAKQLSSQSPVNEYLTGQRAIKQEILDRYKIGQQQEIADWPGREGKPPMKGPWIVFPYMRDNELLGVKYLHLQRRDGKKFTLVEPGCEPTLFGWHAIDDSARVVAICEGELDAPSLYQYGWPAMSVPFGGGGGNKQQWVDSDWDHLARFEKIYLCLDTDEAGREGTQELVQRLGMHRCLIVELPRKDANKCLTDGVSKEEIDQCFKNAKALEPEELRAAKSYHQEILDEFYPAGGELPGWSMPWEGVPFRFLRAELSIITGINGHGKSQTWGQLMNCAMQQGERVCVASLEMKPRKTLYRMVRQAVAKRSPKHSEISDCLDWMDNKLWLFDMVGTGKMDRLLEVFEYAFRRHGVMQFVIDSLMKLGLSEDDYRGQKVIIEKLCDWVNTTGAHVHLIAHPRKGEDESPAGKMDIKGTGAITDLAFNVFSIWRNKTKEETVKDFMETGVLPDGVTEDSLREAPDGRLFISKSRNVEGCEGRYNLFYDNDSMQYLRRPTECPRVIYEKDAPF